MPQTLLAPVHSELLVRKSRFIGCVQPMGGRSGALLVVQQLRSEHPGAAHVCWALMAGGHSAAVDDGEPGGTAGRPMLEVLRHQDLEGVLATVVRYFGGIKLGAGGLVRAYTDAVAQALQGASRTPIVPCVALSCSVPYALEGLLRRTLDAAQATDLQVQHGQSVGFSFVLPVDQVDALRSRLNDATHARIVWGADAPAADQP